MSAPAGWVEALGFTLLHFLWQGAVIGLAFAGLSALTRSATASARYLVGVATLLTMALAPMVTLGLIVTSQAQSLAGDVSMGAVFVQPGGASGTGAETASVDWMAWVVALWAGGVILLTARLLLGWLQLWRLRRSADYDSVEALQVRLQKLSARMGIRRPVALALSHGVRSPVVIGWLKPLVLFPPAVLSGLPIRQIEMVLAHELAHIRRFDHLVNLLQTVVETALFYHPVVRWVSRRVRIERENACDDLAVSMTGDRLNYVEMLASLERMRFVGPRLALGVHDGQMVSRIRRLVERGRPSSQFGLTGPALLSVLAIAAIVGMQRVDSTEFASAPRSGTSGPQQTEAVGASTASPALSTADRAVEASAPEVTDTVQTEPAPTSSREDARGGAGSVSGRTARVSDSNGLLAETRPVTPSIPTKQAERLPPVESLIEPVPAEALALVERPRLSVPQLPDPLRQAETPNESLPLTGGDIVRRIEPEYPASALRRGKPGMVEVTFEVTRDGRVRDVRVLDEYPGGLSFGDAAREALLEWRFEPFRRGGQAIDRRVRLEMAFDLSRALRSDCREVVGSRIPRCY